jgi:hypothetical protein
MGRLENMDAALVSEQNVPLILQGIRVDGPSTVLCDHFRESGGSCCLARPRAIWPTGFDVDQAIPIAGDAHDRHMWMSVLPAYY